MWWIVVAMPAAVLAVLGVLLWLGARERRRTGAELAVLSGLPDTEAEAKAVSLLSRPDLFQTRRATRPFANPDLPGHVVALFNRYEHVRCGEFWIGRAALAEPARLPGFLKIGEDLEFTEILVRPGDPRIYISYGAGPPSSATLETEPTIWHEILIASGAAPERV
jgi:hypothetical protein